MTEDRLPAVAASLRAAARRFGTPAYVTDTVSIDAAAAALVAAFPDPCIRQYSVKANDVAPVIAAVCGAAGGFGANVVSRGEWAAAARAGVPNDRITLEGVGKTDADLRAAVAAARRGDGLLWVAVESADELGALARFARRLPAGSSVDVLLRLNPDVAPETHDSLAVGRGASKFGLTETELTEAADMFAGSPGLRLRGIHLHVGSQLGAVDAWRDGVRRALALVTLVRGGLDDSTRSTSAAGSRSRGWASRRRSVALRPRAAGAAGRAARRPPAAAPGDRAGPVPRREGGLACCPGAPRPVARRPPGRARRRHDRADPAGAVRRSP